MSATPTPPVRPLPDIHDILFYQESTVTDLRAFLDAAIAVAGDAACRDLCALLLEESSERVTTLEKSISDIYANPLVRRTAP